MLNVRFLFLPFVTVVAREREHENFLSSSVVVQYFSSWMTHCFAGCAIGDLAGPVILSFCLGKAHAEF